MTPRLHLVVVGLVAFALAGCVNLAPDYQRPVAVTPTIWPSVHGKLAGYPGTTPRAADLGWRQFFLDPRLRHVVALAVKRNQNLRIAALNIEKAQQQYRAAGAALFPTIAASGSQTYSKSGGSSGVRSSGGGGGNFVSISGGDNSDISKSERVELGFSSYELDFFGKLRNQKQQALEALRSSAATQRSTQISLVAEVANDWLKLAADKELLELARQTEKSQQGNLRLVNARHRYGIATGIDVANAVSSVQTARENVATGITQVARDRDALNLVVGATIPVADMPDAKVPAHAVLETLPAGVPSTVLLDRPDVLASEYTLKGDYASIGAARAAFFPTVSLTASTGYATQGLSNLFRSSNHTWSFSPQIDLPIFDAGANRAALHITKIQKKIDIANYEYAIQTAFSEVADALATRATIDDQIDAQQALVAAAKRAYTLSRARYRVGTDSSVDALTQQRVLYSAQQTAVSKRLSVQTNLVTLYKVLGGGAIAQSRSSAPIDADDGASRAAFGRMSTHTGNIEDRSTAVKP